MYAVFSITASFSASLALSLSSSENACLKFLSTGSWTWLLLSQVRSLALNDAVIEKTAYIYRKALDKGLVRGRSIPGLVAASLYAACRNTETPRTLSDVATGINIKRKDVARCYRLLLRELDLKMPVVDPMKGVARIASVASLSEKTKRKAMEYLKEATRIEVSAGKDPMGLAAAALYLACVVVGENKTQKDIAQAAGVTEVTIRNRYKGLKEALHV